jgi:serine/threonine-protein kinase RsbW
MRAHTAEVAGGIVSTSVDGDQPLSTKRSTAGDRVQLQVPADASLTSVVRVVGTGLAARLGFDVARVEDVRLALDELCLVVLDQTEPGSSLFVDFRFGTDAGLAVHARLDPRPEHPPTLDPLARQVLSAVTSDLVTDGGETSSGEWIRLHFEPQRSNLPSRARGS